MHAQGFFPPLLTYIPAVPGVREAAPPAAVPPLALDIYSQLLQTQAAAMTTLVERVRALQGGMPLDAAALQQRKADIAAGTAVTADNLADRLAEVL